MLQLIKGLQSLIVPLHGQTAHQIFRCPGILCLQQLGNQAIAHILWGVIINLVGAIHFLLQSRPGQLRGENTMDIDESPQIFVPPVVVQTLHMIDEIL